MDSHQNLSKNKSKNIAAAYIRVSTERQKNEGFSPAAQESLAREYAKEKGWTLDEFIFIEDKPASKVYGNDVNTNDIISNFANRPVFKTLLECAENNKFSHLIIYSRDRMTRVLEEQIALELFFNSLKIDINYTKSGENIKSENNKISKFINTVLSSLAEYESGLLSTRIKTANRALITRGYWAGGRAPYGFTREYEEISKKKLSKLKVSDFESDAVKTIYNLYNNGYGYSKTADLMNETHSFDEWTKSKIEAIIKNQTYTGQTAWNRRGGRRQKFKKNNDIVLSEYNSETEIINKSDWDNCLKLRADRNENKDPYKNLTPFILKDKLVCSKCNSIMKPKNRGKNKSSIYKCNCADSYIIPANRVHKKFISKIKEVIEEANYEPFWESYIKKYDSNKKEISKTLNHLKSKIDETTNLLTNINQQLKNEEDNEIKIILETHYILYSKLLNSYIELNDNISSKRKPKLNEEDFESKFKKYIEVFLENIYKEDNNINEDYIMKIRTFVLLSIDKVTIDFEDKEIKYMKIECNFPEFI